MTKRSLYQDTLEADCDSAATFYLRAKKPVPQGQVLFVTTGSVEDEDNAPTTISFGKLVRDKFIPLEEWTGLSAGVQKNVDKTHVVLAGEVPAFRFEGAVVGDDCMGFLEGYFEEV